MDGRIGGFCLNCGYVPIEEVLGGHVCGGAGSERERERSEQIIVAGQLALDAAFEAMDDVFTRHMPDATDQEQFAIVIAIVTTLYAGMLDVLKGEMGEENAYEVIASLWDQHGGGGRRG